MIKRLAIKGILYEPVENITVKGAAAFYEGCVIPMTFRYHDVTIFKEEKGISFSADLLDASYNPDYKYLPEYLHPDSGMDLDILLKSHLVIYIDAPVEDKDCDLSFVIGYDEENASLLENINIFPNKDIPKTDYPLACPA